jgi:hypothetical protein
LQELIDRGERLKQERYDSPKVTMWENDVKAAVTPFGDSMLEILDGALTYGQGIMGDDHARQMHQQAISKVQELLQELQDRNPQVSQAQSRLISQKKEETRASLGAKFGQTTFNGPVTFGDNSPANSIQVGELMLAVINQAEETLPDGPEKSKILSELKAIVSDPTFAAVAGASLPEIIKKLFGA